ncbi:type III secretion protein [Escherichia coli]|nr:type III secretion protein [Escherichia coli]
MADWNGYIMDISKQFDQGVDDLNQQVEKALVTQFAVHVSLYIIFSAV